MTGKVAVLGAINVDLVVTGNRLPEPGETVVGGTFSQHQGGKGGNQAVAAARAGATVAMLGATGDDDMGAAAREALSAEHVDIAHVHVVPEPTGVALIAVDRRGRNQISVAPGANHTLSDVTEDLDAVRPALVLASCEIPLKAVTSAQKWCTANDVPLVVNPAPAVPRLSLYASSATVMTPNSGEVAILRAGAPDPLSAARAMVERNPTLTMVVTLGEDGALVVDANGYDFVEAPRVDAVDTTGAGDCFNGALAAAMADGMTVREAAARAATAAALSVQQRGAREGMPTREQIDGAMRA